MAFPHTRIVYSNLKYPVLITSGNSCVTCNKTGSHFTAVLETYQVAELQGMKQLGLQTQKHHKIWFVSFS